SFRYSPSASIVLRGSVRHLAAGAPGNASVFPSKQRLAPGRSKGTSQVLRRLRRHGRLTASAAGPRRHTVDLLLRTLEVLDWPFVARELASHARTAAGRRIAANPGF